MRLITTNEIRACTTIIANCQRDLKRMLSRGECRDLLLDNTELTSAEVAVIVRAIIGA